MQTNGDGVRTKKLIVIVGGVRADSVNLNYIESTVRQAYAAHDFEILRPVTRFLTPFKSLVSCTADIVIEINQAWDKGIYGEIVLVGYSMGAVTLRKAWMAAKWSELQRDGLLKGCEPEYFIEKELWQAVNKGEESKCSSKPTASWASKVERMVLLGSMDLGWHISHHFGFLGFIVAWVCLLFIRPLTPWMSIPLLDCERGASFVENLRIQWARLLHQMDLREEIGPLFVQIFGTKDMFVSPMEAVDPLFLTPRHYQSHKQAIRGRYVCIEVPRSSHKDLAFMADKKTLEQSDASRMTIRQCAVRRHLTIQALTRSRNNFRRLEAHLVEDSQLYSPDLDVTDVVFVIHGIRDKGYWTQHLAQRIKAKSVRMGKKVKFVSETSTYGYFAMLPFVTSRTRRNKVQWLFNEYSQNVVLYPNANFHFIGHSNGTYLLAASMERSSCIRFGNVAFAGSVVRRDFPWDLFKKNHQVDRMANYLATFDWVVAVFPWFIGLIQAAIDAFNGFWLPWKPRRDLGSAGDLGFRLSDCATSKGLVNLPPIRGGHGAAIQESNWNCLANFVLGGKARSFEEKRRNTFAIILARFFIAAGFVGLVKLLLLWWPWSRANPGWEHGVAYAVGLLLLYRILTRL